jgi:magnesium transporter
MSGSPPRIVVPTDMSAKTSGPVRPEPTALHGQDRASASTLRASPATADPTPAGPGLSRKKRKDHRGGKKKRNRRQSFAAPSDDGSGLLEISQSRDDMQARSAARSSFYRLKGRNISNTSIDSETLLDHRYGI